MADSGDTTIEFARHRGLMTDCAVYVIGFDLDKAPSKVGITSDPMRRMANLQTAHHRRLVMGGWWDTPGRDIARELELAFHTTQSAKRLSGEWFDFSPAQSMVLLMIGLGVMLNVGCGIEPEEVDNILVRSCNDFTGLPMAARKARSA